MECSARLKQLQERIDDCLEFMLEDDDVPYRTLLQAMSYSLNAGGKRLRPALVLEFCRLCGGDEERALPAALSVELLHTYSLIHDDLPCMDNDDLRRGKPTNHKVFGECTATLAGDALQALAFQMVLDPPLPDGRTLRCARLLARAAGPEGICGGASPPTTRSTARRWPFWPVTLCSRRRSGLSPRRRDCPQRAASRRWRCWPRPPERTAWWADRCWTRCMTWRTQRD